MSKLKLKKSLAAKKAFYYLLVFAIPLLFSSASYAYGGKVSTPSVSSINEGSSEVIYFTLVAPITCSTGVTPCEVDLNLTSTDPSRVTYSTNPVVWSSTQWAQTMSTTIYAKDNGVYDTGETVTITATAASNSLYYNGYTFTFPLTINNIEPAPAPSLSNLSVNLNQNTSTNTDVITGIAGTPDPRTLAISTPPIHGKAVISGNFVNYTPTQNYVGLDVLTYTVCSQLDNSICSKATLNFNIIADSIIAPNTGSGTPSSTDYTLSTLMLFTSLGIVLAGLRLYIKNNH